MLMYGLWDEARPLVGPLLAFQRQPYLRFHNTAYKLQLLARHYWLTRDAELLRTTRRLWQPEAAALLSAREPASGLLPPENYCGDIHTKVYGLHVNANCWRGLRDLAAVLDDAGQSDPALARGAAQFRQAILAAVARSESHAVEPPFVPIGLFGAEKPYDVLTGSQMAAYWNLTSNYLVRSGVFAGQPNKARWVADYVARHGGLCMGLLRFDQHSGLFANVKAVDDLYTLGHALYWLESDDVDSLLVCFYGKLAQGLTRDTFIGAEGTGLEPLDRHGRAMYLPPNCASNAFFLWMLRAMLVQDCDTDDDGRPDTLRLLFATPRRWLRDGAVIRVEDAPTAFGRVGLRVESKLSQGLVRAEVRLPPRSPQRTLLRARLPQGWRICGAQCGDRVLPVDAAGTVDLTGLRGTTVVLLSVAK
jgi:hypothetical protein